MATSKQKITEQCQRIYARTVDRENLDPVVYKDEITLLVEQALNETLKEAVPPAGVYGGIELPDSGLLEFTGNTQLTLSADGLELTLPVAPINLPHGLGIFRVFNPVAVGSDYIPIPKEAQMTFGGSSASFLEGQVGYYRKNATTIRFTENVKVLATNPVTDEDDLVVEMFIMDFSQFSESATLPISPDMERIVIRKVLESLGDGKVGVAELSSKNNVE